MKNDKYQVLVVGCGLIGGKRAEQVALHPRSEMYAFVDPNEAAACKLADKYGGEAHTEWGAVLSRDEVDVVIVATPNAYLAEVSIAALKLGKHVLIEKPMGRHLNEAVQMAGVATSAAGKFKVGFNHRYHPALKQAHALYSAGVIGEIINIRARYGHGGRPGYDKEWRGDRDLAGGGELTDQGVHVLDLINWFAGEPAEVFAYTQTAVWPLGNLEDSAQAMMKWNDGKLAQFHTAWTQWKNMFSFEVFGTLGSVTVDGLGRSYGPETLIVAKRRLEGGAPYMERTVYDEEDISWREEWADFMSAIVDGTPYMGTPSDGVTVMGLLDALYRSAQSGQAVNP